MVLVVQDKLWHGFIGQIGGQHNDLRDRLVEGGKAARISVRARQVRQIYEPLPVLAGAGTMVGKKRWT